MIAVSFYDSDRNELGTYWLGPFLGTMPWRGVSRLVRVPPKTHELILRIGLFGATGRADFDPGGCHDRLHRRNPVVTIVPGGRGAEKSDGGEQPERHS